VWSDNQKTFSSARVYQLHQGETVTIADDQVLYAEAVISGQVTQNSDPPGYSTVVEVYDANTRELLGSTTAPPGAGSYQIGGLPAGPVKVHATPPSDSWLADGWADNASSWETARTFTLHAGQHLAQSWDPMALYIDLGYAGEVTGNVIGKGKPLVSVTVTVLDESGNVLAEGRTDDTGSYRLRFQDRTGDGRLVEVKLAKTGWDTAYANGTEPIRVLLMESVTLPVAVLTR